MPRVLFVVPATTYRAGAFLEAAARLGVDVVTASDARQALAASLPGRFVEVPLGDDLEASVAAIVSSASRHRLDAVVALDDGGVVVAAAAAERLGLRHSPVAAVAATRDKAVLRGALEAAGVRQPAHLVLPAGDGLAEAVVAAARRLGYPCVVKPTTLSASRGVIRVDDDLSARQAARRLSAILSCEPGAATARVLVESFVPGREVALEGILAAGRLSTLAIFDKPDPLDGPYFEETIYLTPSRLDEATQAAVRALVAEACTGIGLTEGPVHAEVRIQDRRGTPEPVLIEMAARTIGGRCAKALEFATGATLEEIVILHALGRGDELAEPAEGAGGVMMLPIRRSGRLRSVGGRAAARDVPGVTGLEITAPVGSVLHALPEGDRYLGFLFARAATPEAAEAALREAHARLEIDLEPLEGAPGPAATAGVAPLAVGR